MDLNAGDRVICETESTERPPRRGKIEEVVGAGRYRIHWDDGHESVVTPAAGSLYKDPKRRKAA
jgi:hypothetical protein